MSLILQDSNFQDGITKRYHEQCAAYMNTVDQLQQKIVDGQLEIVNLQTYNPRSEIESPVWYEIKSYGEKRGYKVVNECHFLTSSLRHPKILIKEFSYFLMPCHQHGLRINLLV